jgi:hypothetical protein
MVLIQKNIEVTPQFIFAIDEAMASGEVVDLASYWKQMKLVSEQFL